MEFSDDNSIYEQIKPSNLLSELKAYQTQLNKIIEIKNKALKEAPEGHLRIINKNNTNQFYCVEGNNTKITYIPKANINIAKRLVQKEYNKKILPKIITQFREINKTISVLEKNNFSKEYDSLSSKRQKFVEPVTLPDEEYIKRWLAVEYEQNYFSSDAPQLYTSNGIRVRSKSELIIAETLSKLNIPFRYEFPLKVGKFLFHPDFYCLNVKTRKVLIWEHFGMMDNSDYAEHSIEKQELYTKNGFIPGKNLIFTIESRKHPIYTRTVEKIAREIFA